ncbi:RIP metalloprotease [Maricaulaceae bacterium NA33B04]|nr:RIP metalloprotease [Maricaulaceae bacterium NA33B04]
MFDLIGSGALSLVAFVVVISFVVVIHELGHYWAGRRFGVHAEAFSVGFGPTLYSWRDRNGTVWRIAALPLGGFVQFRGDRNAASAPDRATLDALRRDTRNADTILHFKPVWQRAIIVAAGPIANFILAIALFSVVGLIRGEYVQQLQVGLVAENSAAEAAGFQVGDQLVAMDGAAPGNDRDILQYIRIRAGQDIDFTVLRGNEELVLTAAPRREMIPDGLGGERPLGRLGVGFSPAGPPETVCCRWYEAPFYGVSETVRTTGMIVDVIARLVTGRASIELMNGPIGIATTSGQLANAIVDAEPSEAAANSAIATVSERGYRLFLAFVTLSALLSVTLGLMNLLPIPVLDGGHLVYYAYEAVTQRPPSPAVQESGFKLGLVLLLGTFVVATWNDLSYLRGLFS